MLLLCAATWPSVVARAAAGVRRQLPAVLDSWAGQPCWTSQAATGTSSPKTRAPTAASSIL